MSMNWKAAVKLRRGVPVLARVAGRPAIGGRTVAAGRPAGRRLAAGMAVALALAMAIPGAANAASGWAFLPVTAPAGTGFGLSGITCTSAANCLAVGPLAEQQTDDPVTESWDGSTWTPQDLPLGPGFYGELFAVTCLSADSCTAVGDTGDGGDDSVPLAESWNGTTWTNQHAAPPRTVQGSENTATLDAISCTSAANCMAVGYYATGAWDNGDVLLIAQHWNGSTWTREKVPNPKGDFFAAFYGVSCVTATDCLAVGSRVHGSDPVKILAEQWNGSTWTVQKPPNPGTEQNQLNAISCTAATHCEAAGFSANNRSSAGKALAESWNGSTWTVQATPVQSGTTVSPLNGISCVATADCTAVGTFGSGGAMSGLAEHWNGTAWSQQDTPASADSDELAGLSCRAGGFCLAVGTDETKTNHPPIAEIRNM